MRSILLAAVLCLTSFCIQAQEDPIALEYAIGAFKIPAHLNQQISNRFDQLDRNQTYSVSIVGSADFLGSADNNQVLSNKRVKFVEYHLLKNYSDLRLVIRLDSKGELLAEDRSKSSSGVQEHRMVYIYIEDYAPVMANPIASSAPVVAETFNEKTIAASPAIETEKLAEVSFSVAHNTSQLILPTSETTLIKIEEQEVESMDDDLEDLQIDHDINTTEIIDEDHLTSISVELQKGTSKAEEVLDNDLAGSLEPKSIPEPKKFDEESSFVVGEKLLLSDLNFRPGSHYLRPTSIPTLKKLINVLETNPTLEIEIIGHICCHPEYSPHPDGFDREAGDHKLSYNRAINIMEYLEKNGIGEGRVTATGMGAKERLVYPEETDEDRIKNFIAGDNSFLNEKRLGLLL